MSTVIEELSRTGGHGVRHRSYAVFGAASESAAMAALVAHLTDELGAFALLDGLVLQSLEYDEAGEGLYKFTAGWGMVARPEPKETGSFSISFDFAGASQRVLAPVNPIRVYESSGAITNPDRMPSLIGDDGSGERPDGVEVFEPSLSFSLTHWLPSETVDMSYIRLLRTLIGRVNDASWQGWAEGEVLSLGVSGARRTIRDDWELQFKFVAREHQTNLTIAGIEVPYKAGWDFVWTRLKWKYSSEAAAINREANQVCLTNPFRSADFTLFGIDP